MKQDKINKKIYFWVTGEKFDENNINRIYDEMKYNFYLPSDLANGLSELDYGAITNIDLDSAKGFARDKLINLTTNNPFCYLIEKDFSFTTDEWNLITDEEGKVNLSKLGMKNFPEFEEPTYSVSINGNRQDQNNKNIEENTIHIKPQDEINPEVYNLVISEYNTGFRLLNNLYDFSEKSDLFLNFKDLGKLNKAIQQKNQNNLTKVQKLDKIGRSLESIIPLKIICYMISDAKLLFGNRKEYSVKEIEQNRKENERKENDFNKEKDSLIKEIKDFSKKVGINIESIFDKEGKLLDRKLTIDNPEFEKELNNIEIEYKMKNRKELQSLSKEVSEVIGD